MNRGPSGRAVARQMRAMANPARATQSLRFFKTGPGQYSEGDQFLGLRVPTIRALAREHQNLPLNELLHLLKSKWHEERLLALVILVRQYARGSSSERAAIYRLYLTHTNYINSWDLVDSSAEHIVGAQLHQGSRAALLRLAKSKLLWERRIAVLATFYFIKRGEYAPTLRIARLLLDDPHDLIHKAVGWMLREIGERDRAVEEAFLDRHAARMPRTMLRYAIEKLPPPARRRYMSTDYTDYTDSKMQRKKGSGLV